MDLQRHFAGIEDFRVQGRCLHKLYQILVLVLLGLLADCSDYEEIADYGNYKEDFLRHELGLELANGIPSDDTLWRVMRYLNPKELKKSMISCLGELMDNLAGKQICLDGKEMRGTTPTGSKHAPVQLLSVWIEEEKLSFAQQQIADKSNEITAIPALLESFDFSGSLISIDAMGCQREIAEKIVKGKADYLLALKQNQGSLYEQVSDHFHKHKKSLPVASTLDKDHGRAEKRMVYISRQLAFLDATHAWPGLKTIVMVESSRADKTGTKSSIRYYISSLEQQDPAIYGTHVRHHWGIENGLHWHLDVTFKEDQSRIRKDNGPENMAIIRKLALHLLGKEDTKMSLKRKRKKVARDNSFLMKVITTA